MSARRESGALAGAIVAILRRDHVDALGRRMVIGVAGESGSGKTVTAAALAAALAADGVRCAVLHQDDYFRLPPLANHARRCLNLAHVGPSEVDLPALDADIAAFRAGRDGVVVPRADQATDSFLTHRLDFGPVELLIVEGTYVLLLEALDVRIFLSATHEETRERRVRRNRDPDEPVIDQVLAIEHEIVAAQADVADLVIDRHCTVTTRRL